MQSVEQVFQTRPIRVARVSAAVSKSMKPEIKIHCAYNSLIELSWFKSHPKNRNKHPPAQIERLARIIEYQGIRHPIKVSKLSGYITSGHGRLAAAQLLGLATFPVNYQDYESPEQEYADLQADNAIASWAELDLSAINTDIGELGPDFDVDMLGIDGFEIDVADRTDGHGDEDAIPEKVPARTKLGDLYLLGEHRLLCGDSTKREDVERLMAGDKADMVFTSPPYNAAKNSFLNGRVVAGGVDSKSKYKNSPDNISDSDFVGLLNGFTSLCLDSATYVFVNLGLLSHNRIPLMEYQYFFKDKLKDILIWNKSQCPPNIVKGAFNTKWEYIFCFSNDNKTRGFPSDWRGQYPNVIEGNSNSSNEHASEHKAGFPVYLPEWVISNMTFAKLVMEPFCGTGTTIIACEKIQRKCYAMELDPHYCDIIVKRWEDYTGLKGKLIEPVSV